MNESDSLSSKIYCFQLSFTALDKSCKHTRFCHLMFWRWFLLVNTMGQACPLWMHASPYYYSIMCHTSELYERFNQKFQRKLQCQWIMTQLFQAWLLSVLFQFYVNNFHHWVSSLSWPAGQLYQASYLIDSPDEKGKNRACLRIFWYCPVTEFS